MENRKIQIEESNIQTGLSILTREDLISSVRSLSASLPTSSSNIKCKDLFISSDVQRRLLNTMKNLLAMDAAPIVMIEYLCDELGISTEEGLTNVCAVKCVKDTIFANIKLENGIYAYVNKPAIEVGITKCLTITDNTLNKSTGDAQAEAYEINRLFDLKDSMNKMASDSNNALLSRSAINRLFLLIGMIAMMLDLLDKVLDSFSCRLITKMTHLINTTIANVQKKIGASINWIRKAWKAVKDWINCVINGGLVRVEIGAAPEHLTKAVQDGITTMGGFMSDIVGDIGQYIEQLGEFLYDIADRVLDLKEIWCTTLTMTAMISEFKKLYDSTIARLDTETSKVTDDIKRTKECLGGKMEKMEEKAKDLKERNKEKSKEKTKEARDCGAFSKDTKTDKLTGFNERFDRMSDQYKEYDKFIDDVKSYDLDIPIPNDTKEIFKKLDNIRQNIGAEIPYGVSETIYV